MKLVAIFLILPLAFCESKNIEPIDLALPQAPAPRDLHQDLQDFADLIPTNQVIGIVLSYIITDREVQELYGYARSDEFKKLYERAITSEAVHDLVLLLESYNLPVIQTVNQIASLLSLPEYEPRNEDVINYLVKRPHQGVTGLVDDILRLLPREELIGLYVEKLLKSPEFRELHKNIASPVTARAAAKVIANQDVRRAYMELHRRGLNLFLISKQVVAYFLGMSM
ncbi:uncharacterized protein LOC129802527 [Phlebotomus papatasi]|uniref:uncharacterized protein LOC129802527 n=1 Tax=Phlebotomus papatasi TaxID=29031 RepID=UPI0024846E0A|nr:uncharacterized protein LOC129802527 [Phlebotomus papatasi]